MVELARLQVPAVRTALMPSDAIGVLSRALAVELGRAPTTAELNMVAALSSLETDGWRALWNYNFGNLVAPTGSYYVLPEAVSHRYRPFTSAAAGAAFFVSQLHKRFSASWPALGSGDTQAYALALKAQNYYEADPERYAAALANRYQALMTALPASLALPAALAMPARARPWLQAGAIMLAVAGIAVWAAHRSDG